MFRDISVRQFWPRVISCVGRFSTSIFCLNILVPGHIDARSLSLYSQQMPLPRRLETGTVWSLNISSAIFQSRFASLPAPVISYPGYFAPGSLFPGDCDPVSLLSFNISAQGKWSPLFFRFWGILIAGDFCTGTFRTRVYALGTFRSQDISAPWQFWSFWLCNILVQVHFDTETYLSSDI